jgi:Spy/CpxP family protein refolding chaperone
MKPTIKTLLALLSLGFAFTAPLANAQDTEKTPPPPREGGPRMMPADRVKHLADELKLTDEQKTKVQAIFEESAKSQQEFRKDSALSQDERRAKMQALRKAENEKISAVLTAEQAKKYTEMQAKMRHGPKPEGPKHE